MTARARLALAFAEPAILNLAAVANLSAPGLVRVVRDAVVMEEQRAARVADVERYRRAIVEYERRQGGR